MMLDIKIYGTGTPGYQLAKLKLEDFLHTAGMDFELHEVTKIPDIIHDNISSVPAVRVNGDFLYEMKPNGHYNQSLREAIQGILKMDNYGKMLKIVVPTDFSEASMNAYNFGHHLAKEMNGVIKLAHIYYPTSADVNQVVVMSDGAELVHQERLTKLVDSLNQDWIGSFVSEPMVEGVFKIGFPKLELIELSKQENTIIVMGTTGTGDAFKKVFGSLSLDLIDDCYCPLFLVPPSATFPSTMEIVYLSEDLKNDSLHLLYVGKLCVNIGANLTLVHFRNSDEEFDVADTIQLLQNYYPDLKYHIDIQDTNDVFESVKTLVTSSNEKLVILSTKHRNIFQNLFHKSMTEFAVLNSICPILVLSDRSIE